MTKEQTHFGFKTVDANEKAGLVGEVFTSVADRYDVMNDFMSGGLHRIWKDKMVKRIPLSDGCKILDMAGGTGDISFRIVERAKDLGVDIDITVSDINEEMLENGRARAIDKNIIEGVSWKQADAEKLPFKDKAFDVYTIAFGIRNVTNVDKALEEAFRVLKPGGMFLCLEFSNVPNPLLSKIYDSYSFGVIPKVGKMVTGDEEAYQYLVESIRKFPDKNNFTTMIEKAGFERAQGKHLNHGIVAIHSGWRL